MSPINYLFDAIMHPFRFSRPIVPLALLSALTGILLLLVYRFASDQKAIRRSKDKLEAHLLEVRLFQEQLRAVLRAYPRLFLGILNYLRHSLRPLLIMAIPLLILLVQLEGFFGWTPNRVGNDFLVKAKVTDSAALDQVELRVPQGLAVTAPPLHIAEENEVDWRVAAEQPGEYSLAVLIQGATFSKAVNVSNQMVRLSPERLRGNWFERVLHPGEAQLPRNGPLASIEVQYPSRNFYLWGYALNWLLVFLALSLIVGFALKGVFGVQI